MMDSGMTMAELQNIRSMIPEPTPTVEGDGAYFETPFTPQIGDDSKKPFDLEMDENGVLRIVRNVFMSDGELYELEDKEIPEGTEWIWLKTVAKCTTSEEGEHEKELTHSIEFEKEEEDATWKLLYRLNADLEIDIDFRSCLYETGLKTRTLKCVVPVTYSPDDPSLDVTLYPKFCIRACNDIELSWATLMTGSDGSYYIFQNGKSVKIANIEGGGSSDGGGDGGGEEDSGTGISATVVVSTNPRYDEGTHQLLHTPVSLTFTNGRLTAQEAGAETVIAQAVEESA